MPQIFTNCPEAFDGFSTKTVGTAGQTDRGPLRIVETEERDRNWQLQRYYSGGVFEVSEDPNFPAFLRRIDRLK